MVTKETKVVALADLIPCPDNPNNHPQTQVEAISKSIEIYGQYYPIVVDENYNILCGHGKYTALKALGRTEREVCILKGLTKKQKRKIIIEDNKIQSMSIMNFDKMDAILKEVGELDVIGFSRDYLETIILDNVKDNMNIDFKQPFPNPNAPVSKSQYDVTETDDSSELDLPPSTTDKSEKDFQDINAGATVARVIRCPHCGKEIVL